MLKSYKMMDGNLCKHLFLEHIIIMRTVNAETKIFLASLDVYLLLITKH